MEYVLANIEYWQNVDSVPDQDQENLQRLVTFGLASEKCFAKTIKLVHKIFSQIEQWGQYQQWISILTIKDQHKNLNRSFVINCILLGKLHEINKNYIAALKWYQSAENGIHYLNSNSMKLNLYSGLCLTYWGLNNWEKVNLYKNLIENEIQQRSELGDELGIYSLLGLMALITGNYSEAKRQYSRAMSLNNDSGDSPKIAVSAANLALTLYLQGNTGNLWRCLGYLAQAAQIFQDLGNFNQLNRLEMLKGLVYFKMGEQRRALEVIEKVVSPACYLPLSFFQ